MVKGAASVNRVEIECQILCAALRQSLVRKDKVGAFTSIRELSYLFPDLLPPPEDKDTDFVQRLNFYDTISVKAQSGLNSIVVGYLRSVRKFLLQQSAKENKQEYMNLLNAGFVLRKSRLRLSHDLVVTRRWLAETRDVRKSKFEPLQETSDLAVPEAVLSSPEPQVNPELQDFAPEVAVPVSDVIDNDVLRSLEPEEVAYEEESDLDKWEETQPEQDAVVGEEEPGLDKREETQLEPEEVANEEEPGLDKREETQPQPEEVVSEEESDLGEWEETQPEQDAVVYEEESDLDKWEETQPEQDAVVGEEEPEPEGNFVFDESQLGAKSVEEAPLPEIIRLMETARLIGVLEVQALRAQLSVAPNVAAEQLLLNAGYASQNEIASLHLAQHLLSSGKITIAQFQVAMYDERASGLRMAESLQVRGWLET